MTRSNSIMTLVGLSLGLALSPAAEKGAELSKKDFSHLVATAKSASDHRRLASHFIARAERYEAEALEHKELAKRYKGNPTGSDVKRPMAPDTAAHCEFMADLLSQAAKGARRLAADHEAMAK